MLTNGKDGGGKLKSRNSIRQPLIGDAMVNCHKCKTSYEFVAYFRYFYFVHFLCLQ